MAGQGGHGYLGAVLGKKAARISIGVVALVFAGMFLLLTRLGVVEPSPLLGVIGVAGFVIVALPVAMMVGGGTGRRGRAED